MKMSLLIRNFTKSKIDVKALQRDLGLVMEADKLRKEPEVSLVITGEKRIRRLNKNYRGVDRVTDVLSFEGEGDDGFVDPKDNISYLGEIFICYPRAMRQAGGKGHSVGKEIDILFVHGLYHLLGYDHIKDKDYALMKKKEAAILRKLFG
jgi:probable rRNA maturation factor